MSLMCDPITILLSSCLFLVVSVAGKVSLAIPTLIVRHSASNVSFVNAHPEAVTRRNIGRTFDDPPALVERNGITAAEYG